MGILKNYTGVNLKADHSLKKLSPILIEIFNLIDREHTTREQVADLVSLDGYVCANVFKYLNSALFCLRRPPNTILEAVNLIGLYGIKDLILLLSLKGLFPNYDNWHKSIFTAFFSRMLAIKLKLEAKTISFVYIAALTYHVAENSDRAFEILSGYSMPDEVLAIIKTQNDPEKYTVENAIIHLASRFAELEFIDDLAVEDVLNDPLIQSYNLSYVNINAASIIDLDREIDKFVGNLV